MLSVPDGLAVDTEAAFFFKILVKCYIMHSVVD